MRERSVVGAAVAAAVLVSLGAVAAGRADRSVTWIRAGSGGLERELNTHAARGLRFAALTDDIPCAVAIMQAPETMTTGGAYRTVRDRDLDAQLAGLVAGGFVPRAATRVVGAWREVVFERSTPVRATGAWRVVSFEKLDDLAAAMAAAAAEGYRARVLVKPPFRSWPGLSERGLLLAEKPIGGRAFESKVVVASRKDVRAEAREIAAATRAGWQVDLLFSSTRDGGPTGRRERAAVVLSKADDATSGLEVTLERRSSFGLVGERVVGAAAYWDEYLFASAAAERRQAWGSPVRLSEDDADCGPLGLRFRFDAPRDQTWDVIGLLAKPAIGGTGGYELLVVTDQSLGGR